jgi:hypothetical protein
MLHKYFTRSGGGRAKERSTNTSRDHRRGACNHRTGAQEAQVKPTSPVNPTRAPAQRHYSANYTTLTTYYPCREYHLRHRHLTSHVINHIICLQAKPAQRDSVGEAGGRKISRDKGPAPPPPPVVAVVIPPPPEQEAPVPPEPTPTPPPSPSSESEVLPPTEISVEIHTSEPAPQKEGEDVQSARKLANMPTSEVVIISGKCIN